MMDQSEVCRYPSISAARLIDPVRRSGVASVDRLSGCHSGWNAVSDDGLGPWRWSQL